MNGMVAPLRLRSTGEESRRKVTWLELFFDLIFVAAVSQVAEPLRDHYTLVGLVRFVPLFALIWWAWIGHTVFATRFDTDDAMQRVLTLVQMFVVAVMAANAKDALDSRSSAGFAAAYAALRFLLVAQYLRASTVAEARPLTLRYLVGHGAAAVLWMTSALVPAPERFWIWGVAFAIDLGTPWLAVKHSVAAPPDSAHLPERFGLFTLILLGEAVIDVMQGMESQEDWTPAAAASAFLGMAISFLIWWWYFDGAAGGSEQPVRTTRDAFRFHVWTYAHFPLSLGIVVVGVGIQRIVTAASHTALASADARILIAAVALVMLSLTTVGALSTERRTSRAASLPVHLLIVAATVVVGVAAQIESPVIMILLLAGSCISQLVVSLPRPAAPAAIGAPAAVRHESTRTRSHKH